MLFHWQDILLLNNQRSEEKLMLRDSAHEFSQNHLQPGILMANRHEQFDPNIMLKMGELGLLGSTIEGYGCAGINYVSYGLIARELESVDSGYRSAMSVQSSLVMQTSNVFGCQQQKENGSCHDLTS
jgi:glutaryl-CoA dehydrogenase